MEKINEPMAQCEDCKRTIAEKWLFMGLCGICGLEASNRASGLKRKKFAAPIAESFRQEAIAHYKVTKQKRTN